MGQNHTSESKAVTTVTVSTWEETGRPRRTERTDLETKGPGLGGEESKKQKMEGGGPGNMGISRGKVRWVEVNPCI